MMETKFYKTRHHFLRENFKSFCAKFYENSMKRFWLGALGNFISPTIDLFSRKTIYIINVIALSRNTSPIKTTVNNIQGLCGNF